MHYVRPGAVRIQAVSDAPAVRALAFVQKGRTTVVLINNTPPRQPAVEEVPQPVALRNLPPGDYGVCRCVESRPYEELGVRTVGADGSLAVNVPADCVLTISPQPDKNMPPTAVEWKAEPSFLKTPASRVRLSATAQDPELDRLSYSWSVTTQPAGANATLADPQSATTEASGLTASGRYVFTVTIGDGTSEVKRDVLPNVYTGNQPPVLIDVHNRLPVLVTLPESTTCLSAATSDPDGDIISHWWRVKASPAGAKVVLAKQGGRDTKASGLSVAGRYVFELTVVDRTKFTTKEVVVAVQRTGDAAQ